MTASAALLAGLASANALPLNQQGGFYLSTRPNGLVPTAREKHPAKAGTDDVAAKAKGVLSVIIAIDKQQLTLYSDGQPIAHSRVSTGVPGHPTPTGVFSVIQKDRWHRSNLYYNAPMPAHFSFNGRTASAEPTRASPISLSISGWTGGVLFLFFRTVPDRSAATPSMRTGPMFTSSSARHACVRIRVSTPKSRPLSMIRAWALAAKKVSSSAA